MGKLRKDLTGQQFGELTVIKRAEDYVSPKGQHKVVWLCQCNCENKTMIKVHASSLIKGKTKSCGCYQKEANWKSHHKTNIYNLEDKNNCYLIASNTDNIFYFDYEDYDKIKDMCWTEDSHGYLFSLTTGERLSFHRFVMNLNKQTGPTAPTSLLVDHIDGNIKNNKKENLRVCLPKQNSWNRKIPQGLSQIIGVSYNQRVKKWIATIEKEQKVFSLGYFETKEEAIVARLKKEKELFGEFAGQNFLFKEYGI